MPRRITGGKEERETVALDQPRPSTRDAIRIAATDVFFERSYAAATIREIASRSGLQGGSIYNHYASKQEILEDIMTRTTEQLAAGLQDALEDAASLADKLRRAVVFHVLFHGDRHKEAFLADSELRGLEPAAYQRVVMQRKGYERMVQSLIDDGIRSGVFRSIDARLTTYAIITACSAVAGWFRPTGARTIEEVADAYADFMLNGLMRPAKRS